MILSYLALSLNFAATTYGHGEMNCGDVGKAVICDHNATTASGEPFDPFALTSALPIPGNLILRPFSIYLKSYKGECLKIRVNDKKNPRYVGNGGLDLSRGTVIALTGKDDRHWSGKVTLCQPK